MYSVEERLPTFNSKRLKTFKNVNKVLLYVRMNISSLPLLKVAWRKLNRLKIWSLDFLVITPVYTQLQVSSRNLGMFYGIFSRAHWRKWRWIPAFGHSTHVDSRIRFPSHFLFNVCALKSGYISNVYTTKLSV